MGDMAIHAAIQSVYIMRLGSLAFLEDYMGETIHRNPFAMVNSSREV